MKYKPKSAQGFSLVEIAIVMVIIGLIVAAVTIGKNSMRSAEIMKAYQKVVIPCVAAVSEAIRNGSTTALTPEYPTIKLDGKELSCVFTARGSSGTINPDGVINQVRIAKAPADLQALMHKNLNNDIDVSVKKRRVRLYIPGGADLPPSHWGDPPLEQATP